jgi:hypothetical protein
MLPAGIGYMAGCRLITMLVGSRGRVGLVTPTTNGHLPALFGGPFHVRRRRRGGGGGGPLDDWTGSECGAFSVRNEMRLQVIFPQHQAAWCIKMC